jgi:hypothetical protein
MKNRQRQKQMRGFFPFDKLSVRMTDFVDGGREQAMAKAEAGPPPLGKDDNFSCVGRDVGNGGGGVGGD